MPDPITIRLRENGPLVIQGPIKIVDHLGNEFSIPPGKDTVRCAAVDNPNRSRFAMAVIALAAFKRLKLRSRRKLLLHNNVGQVENLPHAQALISHR